MVKACARLVAAGAVISAAIAAGGHGPTAQAGASTAAQPGPRVGAAILCPPPAVVLMASSSGDPGC